MNNESHILSMYVCIPDACSHGLKEKFFQGRTRLPWGPEDLLIFNVMIALLVTM